jgi:excisionase family DNA binding protein
VSLLTQREVAQELRISLKTLQRFRQAGKLKFMNWGYRTIRFSSAEIEKFKQAHLKGATQS